MGVTGKNVLQKFSYIKFLIARSNKVDFVIIFNCTPVLLDDIGEVLQEEDPNLNWFIYQKGLHPRSLSCFAYALMYQ